MKWLRAFAIGASVLTLLQITFVVFHVARGGADTDPVPAEDRDWVEVYTPPGWRRMVTYCDRGNRIYLSGGGGVAVVASDPSCGS